MKTATKVCAFLDSLQIIGLMLPATLAAILPVHPPAIKGNITTLPSIFPGIHCYIPGPSAPHPGVNLRVCRSTLTRMLEAPNPDQARMYWAIKGRPVIISKAPCAISLDRSTLHGEIYISNRTIVESVRNVLSVCQPWGLGGWEVLKGKRHWIIIVDGESRH